MISDSTSSSLSVVVAVQEPGGSLRSCLGRLSAQVSSAQGEIIVVDGSPGDAATQLGHAFPSVRFLRLPAGTNVPKLWTAGINAARGEIIALTIEQCEPAADWAQQVLRAHAAPWPAIGGAIDIDPHVGLIDWAVYFCRYSRYTPPLSPQFLDDLPGDNCSYKRSTLESLREHMIEGFWETFVHRVMRRRGDRLFSDPAIVVNYCGGLAWSRFLRRRFADGCYFAARRAREMSVSERLLRGLTFFALPPVMLQRVAGRIWRKRRYRAKLVLALPLVICFLVAWAAGEGAGYLLGYSKEQVRSEHDSKIADEIG